MPAAGRGLFALATLPIGTVLPPYSGQEVDLESGGGAYVWCPQAFEGPSGPCVDGLESSEEENPARLVNGAKSAEQCGEAIRAIPIEKGVVGAI